MQTARNLRLVVSNPQQAREDAKNERAFRDLSVFMFGFFSGLLAVAWMVS